MYRAISTDVRFLFLLILSGCFALNPNQTLAQSIQSFPEPNGEFIDQVEVFMTTSKNKKYISAFKDFKKFYTSGVLSEEEMMLVKTTSNEMLGFKMSVGPYFVDYYNSLAALKKADNSEANFKDYHAVLNGMLADVDGRKITPYRNLLEFANYFFNDGTIKYSSAGVNWFAKSPDFDFEYKEGKPKISFEKLDLVGVRKADSIAIRGTSGEYFPLETNWEGRGGKVDWERVNFANCYVELPRYTVNTKKALYEVPATKLFFKEYFPDGPITGTFQDKILTGNAATEGSYPRFKSDEPRLKIKDLGGNIRYEGGFRLQGGTIYGYGSEDAPANVWINHIGKEVYLGSSELFIVKKLEKIVAEKVESKLVYDKDTLYHPSVNLTYKIPEKALSLKRGKNGSDQTLFIDDYHDFRVDAPTIDWKIETDSIILGIERPSFASSIEKKVTFQSKEYFDEIEFEKIQNISNSNPLIIMMIVSDKEGTNVLDAEFLARKINPRFTIDNVQSLFYDLVAKGFITFDKDKNEVVLLDKLFHYTDSSAEKKDYDVLNVVSETDASNAILNIATKKYEVTGVNNVEFSRKQKVAAKPYKGYLQLHKERSVFFDGKLFAGFGIFDGSDFTFEYDPFTVKMDSIRYFDLYVPTGAEDKNGVKEATSLSSRIENTNGYLQIDAPSNKSGLEDLENFPSIHTKGPAYVYYDYKDTQNGAYRRDSFYFELDKFDFKSLDNFVAASVAFKGSLISAGIFPDFEETIVIQEDDSSLGFTTQTTGSGFPTYQDKGLYNGELNLSNKGLLGIGNVNYLNASIDSEDIIFKPKQMLASAKTFHIDEERSVEPHTPQVDGNEVTIDWLPYRDSMYVTSTEDPFAFYKEPNYLLDGKVVLTPDGVKGQGVFEWDAGRMRSKLFSFGAFSSTSDTTSIQIKALDEGNLAFDSKNVNADVDFDAQLGKFKANSDTVITRLPYNQYATTMNEFEWDMKDQTIFFLPKETGPNYFTSIHPNQDSLQFEGKDAFYDLKTSELAVGGVELIETADAYVYPKDEAVEIRANAVISELEDATIIANTTNKNHIIKRATVNIKGRKEYQASGYYEYNVAGKEQEILFSNIIGQPVGKGKRSEKKLVTRGQGEIPDGDNFYIDDKITYKGSIGLNAEVVDLTFDGFARMEAQYLPNSEWFKIDCEAKKENLLIPFDEPKNFDGVPLRAGMFLSKESIIIYPRMLNPLYFRKDRAIIDAVGFLRYEDKVDNFVFGDSLKILGESPRGNMLKFSDSDGKIYAEGKMNLGTGLPSLFKIEAAGNMSTSLQAYQDSLASPGNIEMEINVMHGMTFEIPDKLKKIMINDLINSNFVIEEANYRKDNFYHRAISEFVPEEAGYADVITRMKNGVLEFPKGYNEQLLMFGQTPMKWDFDYQSFVSLKEKNFLISFDGNRVGRALKSYIEYKMPSNNDDRLYVLLVAPNDYYYFFGYKQGVLNVVSNNSRFNDAVAGLKDKEKRFKKKDEEYEIQLVDPSSATSFINRIKAAQK